MHRFIACLREDRSWPDLIYSALSKPWLRQIDPRHVPHPDLSSKASASKFWWIEHTCFSWIQEGFKAVFFCRSTLVHRIARYRYRDRKKNSDHAIGCKVQLKLHRVIGQRLENLRSAIAIEWRSDTKNSSFCSNSCDRSVCDRLRSLIAGNLRSRSVVH